MKFLLVVAFFALASCEFNPETFDWTSIKPITQIKEYREAFPQVVAGDFLNDERRVFVKRNGRIIRGEVASPTEFPFMVGLILSFANDNGWCGGSLISGNFVLTAGSCLVSSPQITALLGASDILQIKEIIAASPHKIHENFKSNLDNDIALVKLSRNADLSHSEVAIARLPRLGQTSNDFVDTPTTMTGWGSTGASNEAIPVPYLLAVRAQVMSKASCLLRFPAYISNTNICTTVPIGTPCTGDEGGPLTIIDTDRLRTQIGLYSYQFSLGCDRGWPAVFTRLTSYLNWIEENAGVSILA